MQHSQAAAPPRRGPLTDVLAPAGMHDHADGEIDNDLGKSALEAKTADLPAAWQKLDRIVITATRHLLFVSGSVFTAVIVAEVFTRYVFGYSMFFANPLSKLLLVWFFLLGSGLALRQGAHMGFDLIAARLAPAARRRMVLAAHFIGLLFFLEMLWASVFAMGPALRQNDPGLDISLVWLVVSVPVGFALLLYHMLAVITIEWRRKPEPSSLEGTSPWCSD
ncbi:MAG: TRAP transporter small permease [Variovorax sp.]|nr:MAG: TRAP transporter small permease [Variovorax sp.]